MMMKMSTTLWTAVIVVLSLFAKSVSASQAYLVATVDLHLADGTVDVVNGTAEIAGAGPVTMSRFGLMAPSSAATESPLYGMVTGTGFPELVPTEPKDATSYMEISFTVPAGGPFGGVYVYATVAAGPDAPTTYGVSSSIDGFKTVSDTFTVPQSDDTGNTSQPVVASNETMYIRTDAALPEGSVLTVRITAATAPRNAMSPHAWLGLANHAALGRVMIYTAPYRCSLGTDNGHGCVHGQRALRSWTAHTVTQDGMGSHHVATGFREHHVYGSYECTQTEAPNSMDVLTQCRCYCYAEPLDGPSPYDACDDASKSLPYAGTVCTSTGKVTSAAEAAAYDACDTIDGDLTIELNPVATAAFPRVRRVIGKVVVTSSSKGNVSLPLLEHCHGIQVTGFNTVGFEMPRLRDMCGGGISFTSTQVSALRLPMLGRRAIGHLELVAQYANLSVDIGSVMGGPEAVLGSSTTTDLLRLDGTVSYHITSLAGLSALQRVLSAPGVDSTVKISFLVSEDVLMPLRDVEIGGEEGQGREVKFKFIDNDFSSSSDGVVELNGLRAVSEYTIDTNDGVLSFRTPRVCGTSWRLLLVQNNPVLSEVDIGSVSGGPLSVDCAVSSCLTLHGSSLSARLERVGGLTRLREVSGTSSGNGVLLVSFVGADAFTSGLMNAAYGTGTRDFQFTLTHSTLPATLSFPGVVELRELKVSLNDGATSLRFPNLAGDEMGSTDISRNTDLTHVDLGSVGGGPLRFHTTSTTLFKLTGQSPAYITSLEGLGQTKAFVAGSSSYGQVTFERLSMSAFPAPLLAATYGGSPKGIHLSVQSVDVTGGGEVVFGGTMDLPKLYVRSCSGAAAWRFPNLATTTMEMLYFDNNADAHTADFGSISGGPRAIVGGSGNVLFLGGSSGTYLSTILGLDQVEAVSCDPTGTSSWCTITLQYLKTVPMSLLTHMTTHGQTGTPIRLVFRTTSMSSPMEVALPNVTRLDFLDFQNNGGVTALRLPNWNAMEARFIYVYENDDLHTADLGSVGGGPAALVGYSSYQYVLWVTGASLRTLDAVVGLSNLVTIQSYATRNNKVFVSRLGANSSAFMQDLFNNATFGPGTSSVALDVRYTEITELRMAGVTALSALHVQDNPQLAVLKFPAMPADGITGSSTVINNDVLPDGCAIGIDPLTAGAFSQFGNVMSTACPA
eukprot:TRINITY_DN2322_c1_g2_i1.p1 TRINITY_DN2322_c1_g2~~TRINITY_DN2322_c1_g2_i1.p1  ORF type:complete len:1181 (+),score=332.00 TRINITY_DN2322_c1_g2_i1:115-3657(+)